MLPTFDDARGLPNFSGAFVASYPHTAFDGGFEVRVQQNYPTHGYGDLMVTGDIPSSSIYCQFSAQRVE